MTGFFEAGRLGWNNLCVVCTDGTMLGSRSGGVILAKRAFLVHCMIQHGYVSKTLSHAIMETLNTVTETMSFMNSLCSQHTTVQGTLSRHGLCP